MAAALLAFAVGCGQADGSPGVASVKGTETASQASASPTPSVDPAEQGRKFAQCMRDHGVDMPDPETDGKGGMRLRVDGEKGGEAKVQKAMEACRSLNPFGEKGPEVTPEQQEKLLAFAQCMRDHGVDMPDPDFSGGGVKITGGGPGFGPDDPKFQKATEACRDKLGQLGPVGGRP
ncbi:hypothetical protein Psi02_32200 [Planotetraspora silvatica]|uniref:Uncharacterized protein n=1 Tax=Planotetraspora silvatica TaxID=234614 RepID=A0A8J3ULU4_9ACTN|nr:hypothetical protein Psi02_32200 [Planotetraspora silvatica]